MLVKKLSPIFFLCLGSSFVWAGCGDDPAPGPPALTADDVPDRLATLICGKAFGCCTDMERISALPFDPPPTTQADCEKQYSAFVAALFANFGTKEGLDSGRLIFNPDIFQTCMDSAQALSCSAFHSDSGPDSVSACDAFFEGKVALGGECGTDDECADAESTCDGNSIDAATGKLTLGVCKKLPVANEPCLSNECASGLVCGGFGGADTHCGAPGANGDTCSFNGDCASGYCDTLTTPKCAPRLPNGMTCTQPQACESGYCDGQTSACAAPKADGAPCLSDNECASHSCSNNACAAAVVCDGQ